MGYDGDGEAAATIKLMFGHLGVLKIQKIDGGFGEKIQDQDPRLSSFSQSWPGRGQSKYKC